MVRTRASSRAGEELPYGLSLSPDGGRVAFHLASPTGYQIWTSDVNGKQRQLIAADPDHLYFGTSWSLDGELVLFVDCHYREDPAGHDWADVCVGKADGSQHHVLTTGQAMWFGATYGEATPFPLLTALLKGLNLRGYILMEITGDPQRLARADAFIHRGLEGGQLNPIIAKIFPFDQIVEAHRYLESNEQLGKIVVTVP